MAKKNTEETILDVQEVYTKTELFVENNKKTLLGVLIAVVAVVLVVVIYKTFISQPKMVNSNEAIHLAEMYYLMDSLESAVNGTVDFAGFEEVAEEFAGTPVAKRAHYQMGIIHRDNGEYELAIDDFKAAGFTSPLLGAFTNGNIGDCLVEIGAAYENENPSEDGEVPAEALSKYKEALPYFVDAAKSSADDMTTQVYYDKAGTVCVKLGDYAQAARMYDGVIEASTSISSTEYKEALRMKSFCEAKANQ